MKIATFQKCADLNSLDATLASLREDLEMCDRLDVDIVCFPECHLTGYHRVEKEMRARAIRLDSASFKSTLQNLAHFKLTIILGLIEAEDEELFNTAVVIRQGIVLGSYRKNRINEKHFQAGKTISVFECEKVLFGINICNDANYPELAAAASKLGAKILFYPLNNFLAHETAKKWRLKSSENLKGRAQETGCWIVSADVTGLSDTRTSFGCTQVVSPSGIVVASVNESQEGFVTAVLEI